MSETRRLVAIFYPDVAGYSRMTGDDEVGSHRRVMAVLDDVAERITAADGEVLRYAGDAILATFPSVVLAVDSAVEIQKMLAEQHAGMLEDQQVRLHIGINLDDVIEDRGEVYGEGVNLAARLEAAAEPGGVCLSHSAHEQVVGKTIVSFSDDGEASLKNIDKPVRIFHWSPDLTTWLEQAAEETFLNKPSIAVLPFDNMSGDPEQEFFSDGISEDIITDWRGSARCWPWPSRRSVSWRGQSKTGAMRVPQKRAPYA